MTKKMEQNYIAPAINVVTLEAEQAIMSASIEQLGKWAEEQDW